MHRGERMLVATLPEGFEVPADPVGDPLGELATIDSGDGDLGLERDAGGDLGQRLKRGRRVHPRRGRASGVPLRGDYGFGDRNDDLVGSRGAGGAAAALMAVLLMSWAGVAPFWVQVVAEPSR